MMPSEAALLLAAAARHDNRKVTPDLAEEWAQLLWGLDPHDCLQAIRDHVIERPDTYLNVGHIRAAVKKIRAERLRAANSALREPYDVDPNDVPAYLAAQRDRVRRIANGETVDAPPEIEGPKREVRELMDKTIAALPKIPTDLERPA